MISPKGGSSQKSKKINLGEDISERHIRSILASAYKAGYDEIILSTPKVVPIGMINNIVNTFTGLEVVQHSETTIRIRSFLQTEEKEIENMIVKMFQMNNVIFDEIKNKWELLNLEEIKAMAEVNMRKMRDHCLRMIKVTKFGGDNSYDYYDFVTTLEKISAECYYLSCYIKEDKPKESAMTEEIFDIFKQLYECFLKREFENSNKLWANMRKISKKWFGEDSIKHNAAKQDAGLLAHYYHIMLLFRHISSRLLSIS
jgi:hypothetical protein